jgi:hypothetical protein
MLLTRQFGDVMDLRSTMVGCLMAGDIARAVGLTVTAHAYD